MHLSSIIIAIIIICIVAVFRIKKDKKKIEQKVNQLGGEILFVEWKAFEKGPFRFAGKGIMVYKFQYIMRQKDTEIRKEAWVKTGGLLGEDWKF